MQAPLGAALRRLGAPERRAYPGRPRSGVVAVCRAKRRWGMMTGSGLVRPLLLAGPQAASSRFIHSWLAVPAVGQVQCEVAAAVDARLLRVDVKEGEHVRAGQQRGAAGQLRQKLPVDLLQLQRVPPGEGAQERPQRGRRPDPAEQHPHRAVTQQAHVIDAVRARGHPRDQAPDRGFTGAGLTCEIDVKGSMLTAA